MKKLLCISLSLLLLLSLAACGDAPADNTPDTTPETTVNTRADKDTPEAGFSFTIGEVSLTPGGAFDPEAMPEPDSTYEIESCAGQGTDTVYSYPEAEVTVFTEGDKGAIYSIYLLDPNTATPEGLYLGDDVTQAETLYGTDYTEDDTELVYTKGATQLRLLVEDDIVTAIEYRLITE